MKSLVLLAVVLLSQVSFAQFDRKGNGGDAVVCRDDAGKILTTEVFDYFEARELRNIDVQLMPGSNPEEIAKNSLATFETFAPIKAAELKKFISEFMSQVQFVPNLVDVPDSNHIALPKHCHIEQVVVQQKPKFPEDKRFLVNEEIWSAMLIEQRAGTILHEAFYTMAIEQGHRDSSNARYYHSKLVGVRSAQMSDLEFIGLSAAASFGVKEFKGLFILGDRDSLTRNYGYSDKLLFSEEGQLLAINYILSLTEVHNLIPKVRVTSIKIPISSETGGEVLNFAPSSGEIEIMGQILYLEKESSVQINKDGSISLALSAEKNSCFEDAESEFFCGTRISISPDGRAMNTSSSTVDSLNLEHWTFSGDLSFATWSLNEKGIISFEGGKKVSASFKFKKLELNFGSLDGLYLARSPFGNVWLPVPVGERLQLDQTSKFSGFLISTTKEPVLEKTFGFEEEKPLSPGSIVVGGLARFFKVRFERPMKYQGINVSAVTLGRWGTAYLTEGKNQIAVYDRDGNKRMFSIKPGSYVRKEGHEHRYILDQRMNIRVSCDNNDQVLNVSNVKGFVLVAPPVQAQDIRFIRDDDTHRYCGKFRWR